MDVYDLQLTDPVELGGLNVGDQDPLIFLPDDPLVAPRSPPPPSITGPENEEPEPGTTGSLQVPGMDNGDGGDGEPEPGTTGSLQVPGMDNGDGGDGEPEPGTTGSLQLPDTNSGDGGDGNPELGATGSPQVLGIGGGDGNPEPGTVGSLQLPDTDNGDGGGGFSGLFNGISDMLGSISKTLAETAKETEETNPVSGEWEELLESGLDLLNEDDDILEPDPWAPFSAEGGPDVDGYAIEMRAEHLREQGNRNSSRNGELEMLKVGMSKQNSDAVTGVDRVRISGHLSEHTGGGFVETADDVELEVDGKLDIYSHFEDGVMMAGTLTDTWEDGAVVLAAMSDDLAAGLGLRVTAPLDLWVQGLSGMEERPGTAFADLILAELAGTHFEREYGTGIQMGAFASFTGTICQTQATGFRALLKTAVRVRNLLPGAGGGAGEPGVSPPPAGLGAGAEAGPGIATQMPMLAAGVGASTARTAAGSLKVDDTIAMVRLSDMAMDLEDLSSLRRTGDTAANLEDLSDVRRVGEAVGDAGVEPGTGAVKLLDQQGELLGGMDVHHLDSPEVLGDPESGIRVLDGTVEEDPYAFVGVYTTDNPPASGLDGPIQTETPGSVLSRPDDFQFDAAFQDLARRFVESGNSGDWSAADSYMNILQSVRGDTLETFAKFGGDVEDLRPDAIQQVSDAYRGLLALADEAENAGDTGRAQAIRQAIEELDELAHSSMSSIMSKVDDLGSMPGSVVGDGVQHLDPDDSAFDVGRIEGDADDGSGLDSGRTAGELDTASGSSVRLSEPPISDDARLRDSLDPGASSGLGDVETGGGRTADITEVEGSQTLTSVVDDDTLTWRRAEGDEATIVGWESGGNVRGSPDHSGALAIESFADARAVDDAVPEPGLASTEDIVRAGDLGEGGGAGDDIGGRLGQGADVGDPPPPPAEVELREDMDFGFDPDGDAPDWVSDNYEVEQKLANGHLPEDFDSKKVMRRWRKRAKKIRAASASAGNQRFAELVDEFAQMLNARECPRQGLDDAMARYTARLGPEEAANTVRTLQTMLAEYDNALNIKYGYRANPAWIADVETALDLRQVDADVDEILRAEDAIWQRYENLDPNGFKRPGTGDDAVKLPSGSTVTGDGTVPVVDRITTPEPDSETVLFSAGSDPSLIGSFDRAGVPPVVPPRPDLPVGLVDDVGGEAGSLEDLRRGGGSSSEPGVGGAAVLTDDPLKDTPFHKGARDTSTLEGYDGIGLRDQGIGDQEKWGLKPRDRRDFGYVYDGDDLVSIEYGVPDEMVLNRRNVDAKKNAQLLPSGQIGRRADILADEAGTQAADIYTQSHRGSFNLDALNRVSDEAASKARLESINKMWNELPQVNLRSLDDLGETAPGVRVKLPRRKVGFGDVQSVTFRIEAGTELSKHGKPLRSLMDASDVLDLDTTLRYSLDPTTQAKIVTTPEGWQATRTPGFGRMASVSGDFPFSPREELLNQIMKGQKLSADQVDLLSNQFYARFPIHDAARDTAQYKAMDQLLETLIVTRRSNINSLPANVDWNALYDLARLLDSSASVA